ncbi:hypothetical protein TruAng_011577 [Truncatella angustata]|nr:hypothetical protein TruAng_011577 [Truncatella angustata]
MYADYLLRLATDNAHILTQRTKRLAFILILLCLLIFTVFSGLYLYVPTEAQKRIPQYVTTSNFTAQAITCGYPASGQYGTSSTSVYVIMLTTAFFVRRVRWLSTAMAASAMTYAGVASIHLMVLFSVNNRVAKDKQPYDCTQVSIGSGNETISICAGNFDPDYIIAGSLVGEGLLAILPAATWSQTFKSAEGAPILVLWTALLATGHIFFNIITPNAFINYQICPIGSKEPLPRSNYEAGPEDAAWHEKLDAILRNDPLGGTGCIYSCFSPERAYLGRQSQEIGVFEASLSNRYTSSARRGTGITFWLLYAILSFAVVILRHKPCRHDIWNQVKQEWRELLRLRRPLRLDACTRCKVEMVIQALGVCSYLGYVGLCFEEFAHIPNAEPFSAVGQWGVSATVFIVLIAAGVSRLAKLLGESIREGSPSATTPPVGGQAITSTVQQGHIASSRSTDDTPLMDVPSRQVSRTDAREERTRTGN